MAVTFTIGSLKGGVGKTTIAENLAVMLGMLRRRALLVDSDIATSGMSHLMGLADREPNLHDLLAGKGDPKKAVHDAFGIKVLPSGASLTGFVKSDPTRLAKIIDDYKQDFDFVVVDTPPGLTKYTLAPLKLADSILVVTTQDPAAVEAAARLEEIASTMELKIAGVVVNRVLKSSFLKRRKLLTSAQIQSRLKSKIIAAIPEDSNVTEAATFRRPIVLHKPKGEVAKAIRLLASRLGV